jgi:hypothetical protein
VKTEEVAKLLKPLIEPLASEMEMAFLFGSVATGYDDNTAQKNLVIIGGIEAETVESAVAPVREKFEEELAVSVFTREEYVQAFLGGKIFIRKSANAPKIFFVGDDGDLWRLYYDA